MAVEMSMPILVVDDYKTMIRIIRNLLTQIGFEKYRRGLRWNGSLREDEEAEIWSGHLRLEHGADDRLRAASARAGR